jgi:regulator of replication initiation timing
VEARLAQQAQQLEQQDLGAAVAGLEQEVQQLQQQRASLETSLQAAVESNLALSARLEADRQRQEAQVREQQARLVKARAQGLALKRQQASKEGRSAPCLAPLLAVIGQALVASAARPPAA